ncbi:putative cell division protein [Halteromyces radiatus]|uniref:putative cell division protein n=1 Tax=Halteromyces radiatus TaxID=101107 RepID=UPI00221E65F1|nr:putative cell division protein [Halteromyces radiatus]KAI8096713.1 putative cell division protein [Halteromyces radiatus]
MLVGDTGLGKSTFIDTLFQTDIHGEQTNQSDKSTVNIDPVTFELEEEGIKMLLTVIDTPGFGDRFDRTKDLEPIIQYIDEQFDAYMDIETGIKPRPLDYRYDTRVHLCLYFINPTGHHLKALDVFALQSLSSKVSLIPVIAKADTMTYKERLNYKEKVLQGLKDNAIQVYPIDYPDEHRPEMPFMKKYPFCVIGSRDMVVVDGKQVRGRQYSWGSVQVENVEHSDFVYLRQMLMEYLLHEFNTWTHNLHYRSYRLQRLGMKYEQQYNKQRPLSLLPCDDDYDDRLRVMKNELLEEMYNKEVKIKEEYLEKIRLAEARLYGWEKEASISIIHYLVSYHPNVIEFSNPFFLKVDKKTRTITSRIGISATHT